MRVLSGLGSLRLAVAVLTAISTVHLGLIAFGNLTDYETNHAFVEHVFAMDTTFKSPAMMWRAITSPGLVTTGYVLIIAWEALAALVLLAGLVAWLRRSPVAPKLSALGWLMELALFAGGFMAIGGEYFQMWQSSKWNGIASALPHVIISGLGLVLVHLLGSRREAESAAVS
ncbi:DUF2165 domain-containing protein [Kutzneria albida]|uniref:Putative secreted protein n=1 Tax=Kutzneria albida DSM 43870 TaxID=1449976 RepID=W5W168_9PSEU|nr:DUF2165 domain-containing protein [Kutzneria albida]AHH94582.1 putative secreted protein [Kutzneria albida DSM 43870]